MNAHRFHQVIRALIIISKQVHSCERKLNKLLEKQGEDQTLIQLTEHLHEGSAALQAAIDSQAQITKEQKKTNNNGITNP